MNENENEIQMEDPSGFPPNLLILPLGNKPIFPGLFTPLYISGTKDINLINLVISKGGLFGALLEKPHEEGSEPAGQDRFHSVGTVCRVLKTLKMPDGGMNIFISSLARFRVVSLYSSPNYTSARVEYLQDELDNPDELKAWIRNLNDELGKLTIKPSMFSDENRLNMINIEDPGRFADYVASILPVEGEKLQGILEITDVRKRIEEVLFYISQERRIAEIQANITATINQRLEKNQRDYFLREEMKQIQKQLGLDGKGSVNMVEKIRQELDKLELQGEVKEAVENEYAHFVSLDPNSADYAITLNYLQTIIALPWKDEPYKDFDIQKARKILEKDHYGMKEVKERILEFLAVRKQKQDTKGAILCLVGPPGVGKTSVGRSIARALDKKHFRFSVGGMKDEAEIKGHRRTYIGALPGKIIQGLKIVKTKSPVFLIDEIDKMGASYSGDPASALLEALDPEQNKEFRDHYLDIPFDVSQVLFIVTANSLETIPEPLLDRMEIIELSGYTSNEKLNIAKKYLLPKSFERTGISKNDVKYSGKALLSIANQYCREAGVRNLEKSLDKINRKILLEMLENPEKERPVTVDKALIEKYLGLPYFPEDDIVRADKVGTAVGLAWTSMGGDTLLIEAENYPGHGELQITGKLGDVMKESVSIAWTYLKRTAVRRKIDFSWFEKNNVHLHIPAGATPKDGPSAGITLTTALYSLLTGQTIKPGLAMTGELTLTGAVMPIGGLREKVLAAKRNGTKEVIIPEKNRRDMDELADEVKEGVTFHLVSRMDEVISIAFPNDRTTVMSEDEYRLWCEKDKAKKEKDESKLDRLASALKAVME